MHYFIVALLFSLLSSLTWCPIDPSLFSTVNTVVRQTSSPSFIPQCAGLSLIGCITLYSWYSCNEKLIKLTTLGGALASSYILYRYVNNQEEVKELVLETTEHIAQSVVESEIRINNNLLIVDARTQQQISHARQTLQSDLINLQQEMQQKMDAGIAKLREQLLDMQKNHDLNCIELAQKIETSFTDLEHNATQRYHELHTTIEQKTDKSDKLLQESTRYIITQMHHMFQEFTPSQSLNMIPQKNPVTPQEFTHLSFPAQGAQRSTSQPKISKEQLQPILIDCQQNSNHDFEQTKQALKQKYTDQQKLVTEQYTLQKTALQQIISSHNNQKEYENSTLTTSTILSEVTFKTPQAIPFLHKSTLTTNEQTKTSWLNMFALFNLFRR